MSDPLACLRGPYDVRAHQVLAYRLLVGLKSARDSWRKRCREQHEDHASVWEMHLKELDATVARAEQAEALAARRLEVLREIESSILPDGDTWTCPVCEKCSAWSSRGAMLSPHAPDCALARELEAP